MTRSEITQARKYRKQGYTIPYLAKKYGVSDYELKRRLFLRSIEDSLRKAAK